MFLGSFFFGSIKKYSVFPYNKNYTNEVKKIKYKEIFVEWVKKKT